MGFFSSIGIRKNLSGKSISNDVKKALETTSDQAAKKILSKDLADKSEQQRQDYFKGKISTKTFRKLDSTVSGGVGSKVSRMTDFQARKALKESGYKTLKPELIKKAQEKFGSTQMGAAKTYFKEQYKLQQRRIKASQASSDYISGKSASQASSMNFAAGKPTGAGFAGKVAPTGFAGQRRSAPTAGASIKHGTGGGGINLAA